MAFRIMAFSIITLSMKGLYVTLNINATESNNALHSDECRYAERRVLFFVMLSVIMMNVVMLSDVKLNVMSYVLLC
jgi:hypothetical protein